MRRLVILVAAVWAIAIGALGADASTSYVARLGAHGAARWTLNASVYVNLKAMSPGVWKQQLWTGTCAEPDLRVAVLPGLVVTSTRTLAKTTKIANVPVSDDGMVLRLLNGTTVICGPFAAPATPSASGSASPGTSASASASASGTDDAGGTLAPTATPTYTYTYMYP